MPAKTQAEPVMVFSPEAFYDAVRKAGFTMPGFASEMGFHPETMSSVDRRRVRGPGPPCFLLSPGSSTVKPEALLVEAEAE